MRSRTPRSRRASVGERRSQTIVEHEEPHLQHRSAHRVLLPLLHSRSRVGSALDNAAAESFFSTLEHELLTRRRFATRAQARREVAVWIDGFYNRIRRHSSCQMKSPVSYELEH